MRGAKILLMIAVFMTPLSFQIVEGGTPVSIHMTRSEGNSTIPSPVENYSVDYVIDSCVKVEWDPPETDGGSPIHSFHIFRQIQGKDEELVGSIDSRSSYIFLDTDLLRGERVDYWVIAENIIGNSSSPDRIHDVRITDDPPAPFNLTAVGMDESIFFSWEVTTTNDLMDPDEFEVNLSWDGGFRSTIIKEHEPRNMTLEDLVNGLEYRIRIRSSNRDGHSAWAETFAYPGTVPDPPRSITAELTEDNVTLSWKPPGEDGGFPITAYWIDLELPSGNMTIREDGDALKLEYILDDPIVECTIRIRSENMKGFSSYVEKYIYRDIEVEIEDPKPPSDFHVDGGDGFVLIEWGFPPDVIHQEITHVNIYRGRGFDEPSRIASVFWAESIYNDTEVENGNNYTYYLTSANLEYESTSTISLRVLVQNGTKENETDEVPEPEVVENYDAYIIGGILFLVMIILALLIFFNFDKIRNVGSPPDDMEDFEYLETEYLNSRGPS